MVAVSMNEREGAVLRVFVALEAADAEGAWAPYYADVAAAAGGDAEVAYAVCKSLKAKGLLTCGKERQGSRLLTAPSYWPTDAGTGAVTF